MPAPKGNQFWKLRSKHGRDKLFATPQLMWEAACEYFQWCDDNPIIMTEQTKRVSKTAEDLTNIPLKRPYTLQGLCLYLDANTVYFNHFYDSIKDKDDEMSKDFRQIITRIRETIQDQQISGASVNIFNSNLVARLNGLVDKQESKHDVSDELKSLLSPFKVKKPE